MTDFLSRDVATQTSQRSDELLVVSLRCILAAPPELCLDPGRVVVPALLAALQLGLRHAPIAAAALDALERALNGSGGGAADAADVDDASSLTSEKHLALFAARLRVYLGTDGRGERAEGALEARAGGAGGATAGDAQQQRASLAVRGTSAKKRSRAKLRDAVSAATVASAATTGSGAGAGRGGWRVAALARR